MDDDSDSHLKRGLVLLLILFLMMQPVTAHVGAYKVFYSDDIVGGKFRCSCGIGNYEHREAYFINKCPHCSGKLAFEQGDYHGADYTSPEGMWYCTRCDMDFCGQCGKEHIKGSKYWLKRTNKPKPKEKEIKPIEVVEYYKTIDPFGKPVEIELKTIHGVIQRL